MYYIVFLEKRKKAVLEESTLREKNSLRTALKRRSTGPIPCSSPKTAFGVFLNNKLQNFTSAKIRAP